MSETNNYWKNNWRKKPPLHLLSKSSLEAAALGFGFGAYEKYAPNDWRTCNMPSEDFLRAAIGHIYEYLEGHLEDPESGLNPLCHALARLHMAYELSVNSVVDAQPDIDIKDDLIRIQDTLMDLGYSYDLPSCETLCKDLSKEYYSAGWMILPQSNIELEQELNWYLGAQHVRKQAKRDE